MQSMQVCTAPKMVNVHYASSQFWQFSLRLDKWHLLGRHHDIMLCAIQSINCSTICRISMHSNKCALFSEKVCKHPSWLWNVHSLALQWRYNVRCTVCSCVKIRGHSVQLCEDLRCTVCNCVKIRGAQCATVWRLDVHSCVKIRGAQCAAVWRLEVHSVQLCED